MMHSAYYSAQRKTEGSTFPDPTRFGDWVPAGGALSDFAASFRESEMPNLDAVRSIPDPWAQALIAVDAALRSSHPQHEAARRQWRGLLALLALEPGSPYSVRLDTVDLQASQSAFAEVLKALPPQSILPQPSRRGADQGVADWLHPVLVRVDYEEGGRKNSHVVGLLNPASLICPVRNARTLTLPGVAWVQQGVGDPLEADLSPPELAVILRYVEKLKADLEATLKPRTDLAKTLDERLTEFVSALRDALKGAVIETELKPGYVEGLPNLYALLRNEVTAKEPEPGSSDTIVPLRADLSGTLPFRGAVLIDAALAGPASGRAAHEIYVWGNQTLSQVLDSSKRLDVLRDAVGDAGYVLVTPDDLFTEQFVRLTDSWEAPAHEGGDFEHALLPLSPVVLLLQTPAELGKNLRVRTEGDKRIVSLTVKLEGANGKTGSHTVTRTYREDGQGGFSITQPLDVAVGGEQIWPDFRHSAWSHYFLRMIHDPSLEDVVRGRFGLSGAQLASAFSVYGRPRDRAAVMRQWTRSAYRTEPVEAFAPSEHQAAWIDRVRPRDTETSVLELQHSSAPFEAVFYSHDGAAGLALVKPLPIRPSDLTETVAVDFGTTNTVACLSDGEPLTFKRRLIWPLAASDFKARESDERQAVTVADFMPGSERALPTPTVVFKREVEGDQPPLVIVNKSTQTPLFVNPIYFPPLEFLKSSLATDFVLLTKRMVFDLKWGSQDEKIDAAERYLRQFMMMVAAEAIAGRSRTGEGGVLPANLEWKFSRPDALDRDAGGFLNTIRSNLTWIAPRGVDPEKRIEAVYSEGLAAANYVLSGATDEGLNHGTLDIVLDIGGGTTDVVFWAARKPVWRGSFRLAGGNFFAMYLASHPDLRRELGMSDGVIDPRSKEARHVMELLLSLPEAATGFNTRWDAVGVLPEGEGLTNTAFVFLGGVVYYLGLVAKSLIDRGVITEAALKDVHLALCGRGAGLFARMHPGGSRDNSPVRQLIGLFFDAMGKPATTTPPRVLRSKQAKLEVIKGLVADHDDDIMKLDVRSIDNIRPLGLAVETIHGPLAADSPSRDFGLKEGEVQGIDMAAFTGFIEAFQARTHLRVDVASNGGETEIRNTLGLVLRKASKLDDDGLPYGLDEPLFITALRVLVDDLAGQQTPKTTIKRRGERERG